MSFLKVFLSFSYSFRILNDYLLFKLPFTRDFLFAFPDYPRLLLSEIFFSIIDKLKLILTLLISSLFKIGFDISLERSFKLWAINRDMITRITHIALKFQIFIVADVYRVLDNVKHFL